MPIYEYQCEACNDVVEAIQSVTDNPLENCPSCSGPLRKLISMSAFHLKGGGWYADGYGSAAKGGCPSAKTTACKSGSAEAAPSSCPEKTGNACNCS